MDEQAQKVKLPRANLPAAVQALVQRMPAVQLAHVRVDPRQQAEPAMLLVNLCRELGYSVLFDPNGNLEAIKQYPDTPYDGGFWLALAPYMAHDTYVVYRDYDTGDSWQLSFLGGQLVQTNL